MTWILATPDLVDAIHDEVLNPGELPGRARDKSLEGALAYGMIADVFDLAAAYAIAIAQGHCFNDANKRTAFRVMDFVLSTNGARQEWTTEGVGDIIIRCAQGLMNEGDLAVWLRGRAASA
jgi:death on curing protein